MTETESRPAAAREAKAITYRPGARFQRIADLAEWLNPVKGLTGSPVYLRDGNDLTLTSADVILSLAFRTALDHVRHGRIGRALPIEGSDIGPLNLRAPSQSP